MVESTPDLSSIKPKVRIGYKKTALTEPIKDNQVELKKESVVTSKQAPSVDPQHDPQIGSKPNPEIKPQPDPKTVDLKSLNNRIRELLKNTTFVLFYELLKKISDDYHAQGITLEDLKAKY